jgi:hypothetical protein
MGMDLAFQVFGVGGELFRGAPVGGFFEDFVFPPEDV